MELGIGDVIATTFRDTIHDHLFINLRKSRDCFCLYVNLDVSYALHTSFGQLLCCAHKRIVNIMKVYIEMNYGGYMQV